MDIRLKNKQRRLRLGIPRPILALRIRISERTLIRWETLQTHPGPAHLKLWDQALARAERVAS